MAVVCADRPSRNGSAIAVTDPRVDSLAGQRILLAAEYIGHGGTRTYFQDLLTFYARSGAEVVAVTTYEDPDPSMEAFISDLPVTLIPYSEAARRFGSADQPLSPTVWDPRRARNESSLFRRLCAQYDIDRVVLSVGTSGLFLSAARTRPSPLMIAHGYPHGRRQHLLGRHLHGRLLMPGDLRIVTVSDFSARLFRRAWRTDARGVDVRTVRSTCGHALDRTGLSGREGLVVTAALLEPYKEPFHWIDAAERASASLPDAARVQFVWMGDGPLLSQARDRIRESGVSVVSFPGWVDDPGAMYDRARAYLQMSSTESLGLSVVDALRHGLPAVVTDAGGLPEVVLDGVNGYVVSVGDSQAAADAVGRLLADDVLWERMSAAAVEVYRDRFSPQSWRTGLAEAHRLP